jgi:hypothetical protein
MINRKLCIVACCLGFGFALVAQAQPSAGGPDDQSKALEALRQAEKGRLMSTNAVVPATPVAANPVPDTEAAQALEALRQAEKGQPVAAPAIPAPAAAVAPAAAGVPAGNPEEDARALDALRQAEKTPSNAPAAAPAPVATAPAVAPAVATPVVAAPSIPNSQEDTRALEALRQAEAAKNPTAGNIAVTAASEQARKQREADAAREEQAIAEAEAQARQKKVEEEKTLGGVNGHEDADTVAAKAALEQYEKNMPAPTAGADNATVALERQKAQEEVARRVEELQKQIKSQPAAVTAPAANGISESKEERLRELLRRYNADEITPLEYHTERAKIVVEP